MSDLDDFFDGIFPVRPITALCKRASCPNEFELTREDRKYCSEECREKDEKLRWSRKEANKVKQKLRQKEWRNSNRERIRERDNKKYIEERIEQLSSYIDKIHELWPQVKDFEKNDIVKRIKGIYFLYEKEILVYIGSSNNIVFRIGTHIQNNPNIKFSGARYIAYNKEDILSVEYAMIYKHNPKYNNSKSGWNPGGRRTPP